MITLRSTWGNSPNWEVDLLKLFSRNTFYYFGLAHGVNVFLIYENFRSIKNGGGVIYDELKGFVGSRGD